MSSHAYDSAALARAFGTRTTPAPDPASCPSADAIYDAVGGRLELAQRKLIVDHVTECAECATAWRLAAELQDDRVVPLPVRPRRASAVTLAAAASVAVAIGAGLLLLPPAQEPVPVYRQGSASTMLESRVTASSLPRQDFRLRWSASTDGAVYTLRVTNAALEPVYAAQDLTRTEFVVPDSALRDVPSGATLLWQVEMHREDGTTAVSPTFSVTVR